MNLIGCRDLYIAICFLGFGLTAGVFLPFLSLAPPFLHSLPSPFLLFLPCRKATPQIQLRVCGKTYLNGIFELILFYLPIFKSLIVVLFIQKIK